MMSLTRALVILPTAADHGRVTGASAPVDESENLLEVPGRASALHDLAVEQLIRDGQRIAAPLGLAFVHRAAYQC
jgi:hypothetical protein